MKKLYKKGVTNMTSEQKRYIKETLDGVFDACGQSTKNNYESADALIHYIKWLIEKCKSESYRGEANSDSSVIN